MHELHRDVTGKVDVTDPAAVCAAVFAILGHRHEVAKMSALPRLFADFDRLYRGDFPGFFGCDTHYHDVQHVLDVTLATARLIDGYAVEHQPLDAELVVVGIAVALFHDAGYIRRKGDTRHQHGAEYTRVHVSRSARFLDEYLPTIGLVKAASIASTLVHFTGYEVDPADIPISDARQRDLGALIGSADVLAQMADIAYLEKCRDRLFREFELGGIAREVDASGRVVVRYASALDLLRQTPDFIRNTIDARLDGHFGGIYRCVERHFDGRNLYLEALQRNLVHLEQLLAEGEEQLLPPRPLRRLPVA